MLQPPREADPCHCTTGNVQDTRWKVTRSASANLQPVVVFLLVTGKMLNVCLAHTEPVQGTSSKKAARKHDCSTRHQPWVFLPDAFPRGYRANFLLIALRCGPLEVSQRTWTQASALAQ